MVEVGKGGEREESGVLELESVSYRLRDVSTLCLSFGGSTQWYTSISPNCPLDRAVLGMKARPPVCKASVPAY